MSHRLERRLGGSSWRQEVVEAGGSGRKSYANLKAGRRTGRGVSEHMAEVGRELG